MYSFFETCLFTQKLHLEIPGTASRSTDATANMVASSTANQDDNTDFETWKLVSFEVIPEKIEMLRKRLVILPSSFFALFLVFYKYEDVKN